MHNGKALMLLRKSKNRSQSAIAKKLNKSQQYISQFEAQQSLNGKMLDQYLAAINSNRSEWEKFKKLVLGGG